MRRGENALILRLRLLVLLAALVALAVLVSANWSVFAAPARLDLLFAAVEAPFGLMMLGLLALTLLAFAAYMASWRAQVLLENRRHADEVRQLRRLAEQTEASRIEGLRGTLHEEIAGLRAALAQQTDELRTELRNNGNALAAQLAELDDRLARRAAG